MKPSPSFRITRLYLPSCVTAGLFTAALSLSGQPTARPATATSTAEEEVKLSPFTVDARQDHGYASANSLGAARVNIPLINVPSTVVVLNEEFLRDMAPLDNNDAFRYVSGMNENNLPYNGQVVVRGFQAGDGVSYRDGLPDNISAGGAPFNDYATIDRVEVIKGPNGVLYGSHAPGGVVNQISKKPLFTPRTSLTLLGASWGVMRAELDTTGPLLKNAAYRLILMRQEGETYNHGPNKKFLVAPSLTWNLGQRTKITGQFMYYVPDIGTSRTPWFSDAANQVSTFLSRRTSLDDHDEFRKHWVYSSDLTLEHIFNENWQLRVVGRFTTVDENKFNYNHTNFRFIGQNGAALLTPSGVAATYTNYTFAQAFANPLFTDIQIDRVRRRDRVEAERTGFFADIVGNLELAGMQHKLITSLQNTETSTDTKQQLWNYPSTSVFRPVEVSDPGTVSTAFRLAANNISWAEGSAAGVQDNVAMFDQRLNVVLGGRYDWANTKSLNRLTNVRSNDTRRQGSYRIGALYKVIQPVALFGNWSQTFIPLSGFNLFGQPFQNQTGEIKEAGVKTEAFGGRLTGTFSVFNLKLDNATRQIVDVSTGTAGQIQSGYNKARGFEMDLGWQPIDEFTLIAGLGNIRSKDEKGIQARGVSQGVNWKTFGKYTLLRGPLKGLTGGVGYVYNNKSAADGNGVIILPAYGLWDALIGYGKERWRIQLNVSNVTDKVYAAGGVSNQFIAAGRPREYKGSFSYRF